MLELFCLEDNKRLFYRTIDGFLTKILRNFDIALQKAKLWVRLHEWSRIGMRSKKAFDQWTSIVLRPNWRIWSIAVGVWMKFFNREKKINNLLKKLSCEWFNRNYCWCLFVENWLLKIRICNFRQFERKLRFVLIWFSMNWIGIE